MSDTVVVFTLRALPRSASDAAASSGGSTRPAPASISTCWLCKTVRRQRPQTRCLGFCDRQRPAGQRLPAGSNHRRGGVEGALAHRGERGRSHRPARHLAGRALADPLQGFGGVRHRYEEAGMASGRGTDAPVRAAPVRHRVSTGPASRRFKRPRCSLGRLQADRNGDVRRRHVVVPARLRLLPLICLRPRGTAAEGRDPRLGRAGARPARIPACAPLGGFGAARLTAYILQPFYRVAAAPTAAKSGVWCLALIY
jgi:hypothetical protein